MYKAENISTKQFRIIQKNVFHVYKLCSKNDKDLKEINIEMLNIFCVLLINDLYNSDLIELKF